MLFTTVLLALAAVGPVFSAPVPSTGLTRRQESVDVAVERLHDTLSTGAPHQRSKRLVPGGQTPERVQRRTRILPGVVRPTPSTIPSPSPTPSALPSSPPTPSASFRNSQPPPQASLPSGGTEDPAGDIEPPEEDEAPVEDEAPAEDEAAAAEDEDPAAEDEAPAEDVEESAGDDGGEGTSSIPDLLPRH